MQNRIMCLVQFVSWPLTAPACTNSSPVHQSATTIRSAQRPLSSPLHVRCSPISWPDIFREARPAPGSPSVHRRAPPAPPMFLSCRPLVGSPVSPWPGTVSETGPRHNPDVEKTSFDKPACPTYSSQGLSCATDAIFPDPARSRRWRTPQGGRPRRGCALLFKETPGSHQDLSMHIPHPVEEKRPCTCA